MVYSLNAGIAVFVPTEEGFNWLSRLAKPFWLNCSY